MFSYFPILCGSDLHVENGYGKIRKLPKNAFTCLNFSDD